MTEQGNFIDPADRFRILPLERKPGRKSMRFLIDETEPDLSEIPVRNRVFSDELKTLTGDILSHEKPDLAEKDNRNIVESAEAVPDEPLILERERPDLSELFKTTHFHHAGSQRFFHILTEMCMRPEIDAEGIDSICRYFQKLSGSQAFTILALDSGHYLYRTIADRGLDMTTRMNLCFRIEDPYLNFDGQSEMLRLRAHLKNDLNFNKRFGTDFLYRMNGIIMYNMNKHGCPAFLLMFYRNPDLIDESAVIKKLGPYVENMIPIVERMRSQYWRDSEIDSAKIWRKIEIEIRKLNFSDTREMHAVYISFYANSHTEPERVAGINYDFIENALLENERLLIIGPGRIVIIGTESRPDRFQEIAADMARNLGLLSDIRILKFPDNGKNILNFIHTGP